MGIIQTASKKTDINAMSLISCFVLRVKRDLPKINADVSASNHAPDFSSCM